MRRHENDASGEAEIDLTPMLDVVFIMLIFFVVTTSFVKESGVEVNRPTAATAQKRERSAIQIAIRPDGEIWIDGRAVDLRAVRAQVERLRAENPEAEALLQGDREAQVGVLVAVMDEVRQAGVQQIAIAAAQAEP